MECAKWTCVTRWLVCVGETVPLCYYVAESDLVSMIIFLLPQVELHYIRGSRVYRKLYLYNYSNKHNTKPFNLVETSSAPRSFAFAFLLKLQTPHNTISLHKTIQTNCNPVPFELPRKPNPKCAAALGSEPSWTRHP